MENRSGRQAEQWKLDTRAYLLFLLRGPSVLLDGVVDRFGDFTAIPELFFLVFSFARFSSFLARSEIVSLTFAHTLLFCAGRRVRRRRRERGRHGRGNQGGQGQSRPARARAGP